MKSKISADEKRWRAESDLDSLKRAMEIKNDKARFAAAQGVAKQQIAALGGLVKSKTSSSPTIKRKK
jgi:hypothetical protein